MRTLQKCRLLSTSQHQNKYLPDVRKRKPENATEHSKTNPLKQDQTQRIGYSKIKDDSMLQAQTTKFGHYQSRATMNTINHDIAMYKKERMTEGSKISVPSITGYLKPKCFSLASGDGATDEYAYRQRRNALERIYDNEDNLAMANFVLSYAGRSTIAPWSTKENYEYLVGTSNCMSTFQDDSSRDNSKMLLSMYMFSSDLFSERLATDLVPILSNFKKVHIGRHEQYLRLIDPRCPLYFFTQQQNMTYHSIKNWIIPHWQNPSGDVTLMSLGLCNHNVQGASQEIVMPYILADVNDGVIKCGVIRDIHSKNIDMEIDKIFKMIPTTSNFVIPFLWNGVHSATNTYLSFRMQNIQDEDGHAEDVIATETHKLYSTFFIQPSKKQISKRQEVFVDRYQKNIHLMRMMNNAANRNFACFLIEREYPDMQDCGVRGARRNNVHDKKSQVQHMYENHGTYPHHVLFPRKPHRDGFPKSKWQRTEIYPCLYGLSKTPENNERICNDNKLKEFGRYKKDFQERQMLKLDPEWYDELFSDWHEVEGKNYMLEIAIYLEYMRYHLDLMYNQPLSEIPYEQHKYLGNRQYEKIQLYGDTRDWEIEFLEKELGSLGDTYYSADGTWSYTQEYEQASTEQSASLRAAAGKRMDTDVAESDRWETL
jgi:hypothetical protein